MVRSVRAQDGGHRDAFSVPFSFGNELGKDERNVDGDKSIIAGEGFFVMGDVRECWIQTAEQS